MLIIKLYHYKQYLVNVSAGSAPRGLYPLRSPLTFTRGRPLPEYFMDVCENIAICNY